MSENQSKRNVHERLKPLIINILKDKELITSEVQEALEKEGYKGDVYYHLARFEREGVVESRMMGQRWWKLK
jgi:DNA-binding PadR family transcriptional regulator